MIAVGILIADPASAQIPRCSSDMTLGGSFCIDKYEASVWRVANPTGTGKALVTKIVKGRATAADLAAGATQLGAGVGDDYPPCAPNGQAGCDDVFAVSISGVKPSGYVTWFQAQQACANAGKRLPRNDEWQQAVAGTPNPGPDNGTTDCASTGVNTVSTGSRSACVSRFGNFDMVGNVSEWVEEWVPKSSACPGWGFPNDTMCFAGASTGGFGPGALVRGGNSFAGTAAGPLAVDGTLSPSYASLQIGFRCAR